MTSVAPVIPLFRPSPPRSAADDPGDLGARDPRRRRAAALRLAGDLLDDQAHPGPAGDRERLVTMLEGLLPRTRRTADLAALLALCAALGDGLPADVRQAVRDLAQDPGRPLALAVAAHVCAMIADGFPVSSELLTDLAALVGTPEAVRVIADRSSSQRRAARLVLAIARSFAD